MVKAANTNMQMLRTSDVAVGQNTEKFRCVDCNSVRKGVGHLGAAVTAEKGRLEAGAGGTGQISKALTKHQTTQLDDITASLYQSAAIATCFI